MEMTHWWEKKEPAHHEDASESSKTPVHSPAAGMKSKLLKPLEPPMLSLLDDLKYPPHHMLHHDDEDHQFPTIDDFHMFDSQFKPSLSKLKFEFPKLLFNRFGLEDIEAEPPPPPPPVEEQARQLARGLRARRQARTSK
jgi:hypothetical protein